jgi:hypothetical protein
MNILEIRLISLLLLLSLMYWLALGELAAARREAANSNFCIGG